MAETYTSTPIFTAGTGSCSATLVFDFDYDNYFLFTYRWQPDAHPSAWDAIDAVSQFQNGADNVTIDATDWGSMGMFVNDIAYPGGVKHDYGTDPTIGWILFFSPDNEEWAQPYTGCSFIYLEDGDWISWVWTNSDSKNNWIPRRSPGMVAVSGPQLATVQGKVNLQGYIGDNMTVGIKIRFQSTDGIDNFTRYTSLASDGSFTVADVLEDNYTITVQGDSWLKTVKTPVTVLGPSCDIGTFTLRGADINGDSAVSFEDFALLQNNYGQSGVLSANPLSVAAATGSCGLLGVLLLSCLGLAVHLLGLRQEI